MIHDPTAIPAANASHSPAGAGTKGRHMPLLPSLIGLALVVLYAPGLWETAKLWMASDLYQHGVFIFPLAAFLVWAQRSELAATLRAPSKFGLIPLAFGVLLETLGYLSRLPFIVVLSLVPTLAGVVILLYGREVWKRVRFPVWFLILAAPFPFVLLAPADNWIQNASTSGSVAVMHLLGYPIIKTGNIIEIPGMTLQVAEVCSGFRKLLALLAFGSLYGYVFLLSPIKRATLIVSAIPIALAANVIRISVLIAVSSSGGQDLFHKVHDWAEIFVLFVSFCLFLLLGKVIGCKTLRFSL
jgi:exosortase